MCYFYVKVRAEMYLEQSRPVDNSSILETISQKC